MPSISSSPQEEEQEAWRVSLTYQLSRGVKPEGSGLSSSRRGTVPHVGGTIPFLFGRVLASLEALRR